MSLLQQLRSELNSSTMDSPIVKWGGIATLLVIVWSIVLMPYLQWRSVQQGQYAVQTKYATKLQAIQLAAKDWQLAHSSFQEAEQAMTQGLFQQSSYIAAQAALLDLLRKELKKYDITLSLQRLKESEVEPYIGQRISVTMRINGELHAILQLLHSLSSQPKLLNFDSLLINRQNNNKVDVTMQLSAFRLSSKSVGEGEE